MTHTHNSSLIALSSALADAVASLGPCLVRIPGRRGSATGVAWAPRQVVTTARAIGRRSQVPVVLPDGSEHQGTVTGLDWGTDLALVTLPDDAPALSAAPWAESDGLRTGHLVLVLGRPGRQVRATLGMVSAIGGPWVAHGGSPVDAYLDVDASLPAGFAGGPLVDSGGQVIGLNSRRLRQGGTTLPTATVRRVVADLVAHGGVQQAWLGVGVQGAELPDGAGQPRGLLITAVASGGPADAAGVVLGDAILALGDVALSEPQDLLAALAGQSAGAQASLRLWRAGAALNADVTLGTRPTSSGRRRCG